MRLPAALSASFVVVVSMTLILADAHATRHEDIELDLDGVGTTRLPSFDPPYEPSSVISGVTFDWESYERRAGGSDNWPMTWSDDDHQYTSWGDGGGFPGTNSHCRVSLGVARVEGIWEDYEGYSVWGCTYDAEEGICQGTGPDTSCVAESPATFTGKSYGMISVGGVLYMWRAGRGSDTLIYTDTELCVSYDKGGTWTRSDWDFKEMDEKLVVPTMCNFGKDNAGARDDYVYHYFVRKEPTDPERLSIQRGPDGFGKIDLARVHKDSMMVQDAYEFFGGLDGNDDPVWLGIDGVFDRVPVHRDANGVGWNVSVSYNAPLGRYILLTAHTHNRTGFMGMFDAPEPWGPWTIVKYYEDGYFGEGSGVVGATTYFWNFAPKWLSEDGLDFTLVFTGGNGNSYWHDSWNALRGHFAIFNNPPNDPSDVVATSQGADSILVTWTDNGDPDEDNVQYFVREVSDTTLASGWLDMGVTEWGAGGLEPDSTYQFEVQCRDDGLPALYSNWVLSNAATTDPPPNNPPHDPSDVVATAQGPDSIHVAWTDNGDPDGDAVEYFVREVTDTTRASGWLGVGVTEWSAGGLEPDSTCQFEVRGRDDGVPPLTTNWVPSNEATTDPPPNNPPNDPTDVVAMAEESDSILVAWTDNGDPDGDSVQYFVRDVNDTTYTSGWLGVGVTDWGASGLEPDSTYQFEVRGRDDGVPPLMSNWVQSNAETTDPSENNPPHDPSDVLATVQGQTSILITWTDNGDPDGDGVQFWVRDVLDTTFVSGWLDVGILQWLATGLEPDSTYQFEGRGRDDGVPNLYSNWVQSNQATTDSSGNIPPRAPSDVLVTAVSEDSTQVGWSDQGDANGHRVRFIVKNMDDPSIHSGWLPDGVTRWTIAGTPADAANRFLIQGRDDGTPPEYSEWVACGIDTRVIIDGGSQLTGDVADVAPSLPTTLRLLSAYPTPFRDGLTIPFELPDNQRVRLTIHDASGRLVRTLVDREFEHGRHLLGWDGRSGTGAPAPSGIFFLRMRVMNDVRSSRVVLLR